MIQKAKSNQIKCTEQQNSALLENSAPANVTAILEHLKLINISKQKRMGLLLSKSCLGIPGLFYALYDSLPLPIPSPSF